ncbi:hypothetical protein PIIN_02961 [Serendipita indica DSM 11827]|uniref:Uncharacterized protein n=1 Tax=Serendipita indica (strain DSM 11827) TaxID=1109443 RepID=G4U2C7_SERID|nr:hypothetical protein PIIN_02961 [Serendipita indica DSM 11827]
MPRSRPSRPSMLSREWQVVDHTSLDLGSAVTIAFNVPPLTSGQRYLPPSGSQINKCQCSSVYYSLLSACAVCQGSPIGTFKEWTGGCFDVLVSIESYPLATPNGTQIPPWAFMRLSNDVFSVTAAGRNATGDPSFGAESHSGLSTAAIIALAVGTVVALILVSIAVYMFCRFRRKHARGSPVGGQESGTSSLNPDSAHNRVRYGRIEGPPRKERTFFSYFQPSASKIKSYRPGLNFDLDKGRRGDLLELSESTKALNKRLDSSTSRLPSSHSGSGTTTRVSMESSVKLAKKKDVPKVLSDPNVSATQSSTSLSNLFSRPKEVKHHKRDTRLDLAEDGPDPAPRASRDTSRGFQDDHERPQYPI